MLGTIRNDSGNDYKGWTFTTVKDWGEYTAGTWTLTVRDGISNDAGMLVDWSLAIHGTAAPVMPEVREISRPAPDVWRLRFASAAGVTYRVFRRDSLTTGSWQAVGGLLTASAVETVVDIATTPGTGQAFFRVAPAY